MNKPFNLAEYRDAALAVNNSGRNVHDCYKHLEVPQLQAISESDRLPWHTCLVNITGDLNIGTMIRTSHCLGAKSVTVFGRRRYDKRGTVGSENYIEVNRIDAMQSDTEVDCNQFWRIAQAYNWYPIFAETGGTRLSDVNWIAEHRTAQILNREICLVMGNETNGLPAELTQGQKVVSISQRGVIRSLNVAVAHAMVANSMLTELNWL